MRLNINIGDIYGKLTIINEANTRYLPSGQPNRFVLCKCECGKEKEIRLLHLVRFRTISCGCYKSPKNIKENPLLRKVWRQMKNRCTEFYFENHLYFKKGINVCKEWKDNYDIFCNWSLNNGYKKGLQLDRIDNSKGYNPDNCRWATPKENVNNRDNTMIIIYKGRRIPLMYILEEKGLINNMGAVRGRIKRGWEHDLAIDKPIKKGNYFKKYKNL